MVFHYGIRVFGLISIILTLVGCGGGTTPPSDANKSPFADAGSDQTISVSGTQTKTVYLSGSATDTDGTIVAQQWTATNDATLNLIDSDTSTAQFIVGATEKTYTFTYTVTDDDGAQDSDDVSVNVIINNTPTVDAGADQTLSLGASETATIILTGSSSDTDGTIVGNQWEQTQGLAVTLTGADTANASFPVSAITGTYTFIYTVTDDDGAQSSDEVNITINLKPIANAGSDQAAIEGEIVTLNGSNSTDSDGTTLTYTWTQTDSTGITATLSDPTTSSPTFTAPAVTASTTLTFELTVNDEDGAEQSDTVAVYVSNILLSDSFTDASNWDTGTGSWTVTTDNQLRHTGYNVSRDGTTSYQLGTYAQLVDGSKPSTSSYRFSVDVTPLTNLESDSSQGNDVGIMFGYEDESNYYRVAMNARYGFTRFEKCSGGSFQTLAVNSIGYVENQSISMAAEVNGATLIVWIDGDPVFATVDPAAPTSATSVALYCQDRAQFDNVMITENSLQPTVVISTPLAYSVTPNDSLSIEAVVLNAPDGSSLTVSLDGGEETTLSDAAYSLEAGNHDILVSLKDTDAVELNYDLNSMVGTGGNYIVTIGDSITNGTGDDHSNNNETLDGRMVAIQGFQAPLSEALATSTGLPCIVFNEGVGGDTSTDLEGRLASIIARHPDANKVLMMIGTNDSDSSITLTQYHDTVDRIVSTIAETNGKQLWIAKPMKTYLSSDPTPTTLDDPRNTIISQYNAQIEIIAGSHDNTAIGPDFYSLFNTTDYYYDYLHPNNTGYGIMAVQWNNKLNE